MATVASVGVSTKFDSAAAAGDAVGEARAGLAGAAPSVALVFASADHDHDQLLATIEGALPGVSVVGCSGEGIIAHDDSNETLAAVAVMLVASDRIRFETVLCEDYGADPEGVGRRLAAIVNAAGANARGLCLMPDGLHGDCTALLRALHADVALPIPIVGGAAADAMTFDQTFQYGNGRVVSGGLAALLICGDVDIEVAVSHGCSPIGTESTVTKSSHGWIHEIDGRPAWELFKEYLDEGVEDLNGDGIVHLCIGERLRHGSDQYDPYVIRTPLQLDKASGSLFFPGGGLTEGDSIQLTRRDPEKIRTSALECASGVGASHAGRRPDLVLQFDCAGRGRILWGGCASAEIVAPLRQALGASAPWIGFHTYGEIAPIAGEPYYHNYTVALCALYERPAA